MWLYLRFVVWKSCLGPCWKTVVKLHDSARSLCLLKGKEAYFPEVPRKPISDSLVKTGPGLPTLDSLKTKQWGCKQGSDYSQNPPGAVGTVMESVTVRPITADCFVGVASTESDSLVTFSFQTNRKQWKHIIQEISLLQISPCICLPKSPSVFLAVANHQLVNRGY